MSDGLAALIGSLLTWLHQFTPNICPGSWPWAVTLAGVVMAAMPLVSALFLALSRKGIGNSYSSPVVLVFGLVGVSFGFVLPWLFANVVSGVLSGMYSTDTIDLNSLNQTACVLDRFGTQAEYLRGMTVYEAVLHPTENSFLFGLYFAVLVGIPALCVIAVVLQQRSAVRGGPRWPGRLTWLPFLAVVPATVPLQANVMAQLWLGFLPASIVGILLVKLLGQPSYGVLNRQSKRPPEPAARPPQPAARAPQPSARAPQASFAGASPAPAKPPLNPTRVAAPAMLPSSAVPRQPTPATALAPPPARPASRLAENPGPLPFPSKESTTKVLWNSAGGRFRRVRQLGHGGFGTVWLAVDTQLDRTVALKFAHAPDNDTQQRMMREARALAAVHHPNCVRVYDIIEDVDGLGIVMEYIDGAPLADAVFGHGPLDDLAAARLWSTMAGALGAAHSKGVLHRDVKPANVLLDQEGIAHLIDFGIARSKGDVTLTAAGMMMGTPDFLAPETAATGVATPASDAWQLAATVSYALTGQPPRGHRENPMSALMAAAQKLPNTHLPERSRHRALLRAALDPDPGRRPTLNTVQRELASWIDGAGHTLAGPVTKVMLPAQRPL